MKITPSALIDELYKTSGGTTIQNSYGGLQLHRKAYQKKKKSPAQQKTRSAFTNVQSSWGSLTPEEQASWNAAAAPGTSGWQLYSSTNNILVGLGSEIINEYNTPITPFNPELTLESIDYLVVDGYNVVDVDWTCSFDEAEIVANGWLFYFKWAGWINGSAYRFPEEKLTVGIGSIGVSPFGGTIVGINVHWNRAEAQGSPGPVYPTQKTKITIGWINKYTGQITTGESFNIAP